MPACTRSGPLFSASRITGYSDRPTPSSEACHRTSRPGYEQSKQASRPPGAPGTQARRARAGRALLEQGAPRAEIEKQEARIEATHAELAAEELRLLNGGKLRF